MSNLKMLELGNNAEGTELQRIQRNYTQSKYVTVDHTPHVSNGDTTFHRSSIIGIIIALTPMFCEASVIF